MLRFVWGIGEKNLSYFNSEFLCKALRNAAPHEPNNMEQIAYSLAIGNPEEISKKDVMIYGQVLEVLMQIKLRGRDDLLIEEWATKARMSQQNPGSINYLTNRAKTSHTKGKEKMEGIEALSSDVKLQVGGSKKRRQEEEETVDKKTEESIQYTPVENKAQTGAKEITILAQDIPSSKPILEINSKDEQNTKEKKQKKDQEITLTIQSEEASKACIEEELVDQEIGTEDQRYQETLDNSLWSPHNRKCDQQASYKAKIASYKVPGETKEYRTNYMKWVLRENKILNR